ncbi:MAG: DNA polymerase IV [Clostridia bacterium]|nr:DNA polymerase IV [Clostridia bacterium]
MERQILHVDVNNAFLSWLAVYKLQNGEKVDIREQVAVIGGDETKRSGIVLAKSPKAKQFGIVTGETLYSARQKCRNLQVYQGDFKIYREYSNKLYNLLLQYTDKIERFSIDECFLDMTNYLMNDTLLNKAKEINRRVKNELGFTVNVGVANNKLLAKMASDFTKPDRVHTLFKEEIPIKMWNLPISELFMIGKKTVPKLYNMKIRTIRDLANADKNMLIKKFGKHGKLMWEYANGIDNSEVQYIQEKPKSIGNSVTLPMDIANIEQLEEVLLSLTEQVAYRLRKQDMVANVVCVQLRTKEFEDFSHQAKLDNPTSSTKEIIKKAKQLLSEMFKQGMFIRLIGVRIDNLVPKDGMQLSLFGNTKNDEKQKKLDSVIDLLNEKYGYNSITRAGKLKSDEIVKIVKKEK